MDDRRFDRWTLALGERLDRRGVARLAASALSALGLGSVFDDASGKKKKRKKKKKKKYSASPPPPPNSPPGSSPTSPPGSPPAPPPPPTGPSETEILLLAGNGLWFELNTSLWICQLYDFKIGSLGERKIIRTSYPWEPSSGQCRMTIQTSVSYGSVWSVTGDLLSIQFSSGYREQITLVGYDQNIDVLKISRATTGVAYWAGCASQYTPFQCT